MTVRIIGSADEFWRVRVTRVDTTSDLDFEWHDDVLYRAPATEPINELHMWHVEAVRVDDRDVVRRVATFEDRDSADEFVEQAREDLVEMTKSQFEAAYIDTSTPAQPPSARD